MKNIGVIICTILFILPLLLILVQIWFDVFSPEFLVKLLISLGLLWIIVLVATIIATEYFTDKKQKEDGYLL